MAFRRFRKRFRGAGFRRRRPNPYELAQISICRSGLSLGLSDCNAPDQFFHCLVSYNEWMAPTLLTGANFYNANAAHAGKSITVRGIQFDYQYSYTPQLLESTTLGVTSIRSALVVMQIAGQLGQGSGGEFDPVLPSSPSTNMLYRTETLRANVQSQGSSVARTESFSKFRMLWRGMDMMGTTLPSTVAEATGSVTPSRVTQSRHVRVRTAARLQRDEGLFLVTEVVNPFLEDNPTIGLDLFGSLVIKTNFTGPVKYDVSSI